MKELDDLLLLAQEQINHALDTKALEQLRVNYLGKKGTVTEQLKSLGSLSAEDRPIMGQKINDVKVAIKNLIDQKALLLQTAEISQQLQKDAVDISLPGRRREFGSIHPISQTRNRLENLFSQMGFSVLDGPEIEDDFHNFGALNIPELHPSRAMQDTFYFADKTVLRTHMSPVQIRAMEKGAPPLRIIAMGRVYRSDFDITHTPMFHQIEGLMVGEHVTFADLKGTIIAFLKSFFAREVPIRFRASYFPFTEPSAEVDIGCLQCASKGCRICKNTGWLEVLGCGMVHPNVFKAVNIDAEKYSGWAFGAGIDRLTMLRFGLPDLRTLFENDLRFLRQF